MAASPPARLLTRTVHPEAVVLRLEVPHLVSEADSAAMREALFQEVKILDRPLVLDLSAVEYLSSPCLGWLVRLRRQLMDRGWRFQPPCRRRGLFAFPEDQAAALAAIRRGDSDPLLLCGVRTSVKEVFEVCREGTGGESAGE